MGLLSWFTSGSKAAQSVVDGAIAGVDKLVLTDEERQDARQKILESWVDLQKSLGEETTVRSITRRFLAFMILMPYVLLCIVAAAAGLAGGLDQAKFLLSIAEGNFGWLALAVGGFYFGPPMVARAIQTFQNGKNGQPSQG